MPALEKRAAGRLLPGGYRLERVIDKGCFAVVYEARSSSGERVAVKIPISDHPQAIQRFHREIKVMQQLPQSEHVVTYIDHGEMEEGTPFLVLEYILGFTLAQVLQSGRRLTESAACALMTQLCEAFEGLHKLGMTHGDIKPANIMLAKGESSNARRGRWTGADDVISLAQVERSGMQMKLIDFGLVRDAQGLMNLLEEERFIKGHEFADDLDTGMLAGTPEFISPEQITDARLTDPTKCLTDTPSDVFGLGVIFYTLLHGATPWPFLPKAATADDYRKETKQYLDERVYARADRLPSTSPALWSIIARSIEADPKKRQGSAMELKADIVRYVDHGVGVPGDLDNGETVMAYLADLDPRNQSEEQNILDELTSDPTPELMKRRTSSDLRRRSSVLEVDSEQPPMSRREKAVWLAFAVVCYTIFAVGDLI